jgi:hypothetical protein
VRKVYIYPKFSKYEFFGFRIGGNGLGNLLFIFARAVIYAKKYQVELINPTWKSIKLGTILRGERDARTYGDLFDKPIGVSGIKKFFLLFFAKKYPENKLPELKKDFLENQEINSPVVIECTGHEDFFEELIGYRSLIRNKLLSIITDNNIENIKNHQLNDGIVVHIRMGDFQSVPSDLSKIKPFQNYRLPIAWYISMIDKIREHAGIETPVYIFSDGKASQLSEILCKENIFRIETGNSISDMISLSSGAILIGSGSTFSMWASFLGGMPSIWYPSLHLYKLLEDQNTYEGEINFNDQLPEKLLININSIFRNA